MSKLRIKYFVMLPTNTQIFSRLRPWVDDRKLPTRWAGLLQILSPACRSGSIRRIRGALRQSVRPGVEGHEALLIRDPSRCDYARNGLIRKESQGMVGAIMCMPAFPFFADNRTFPDWWPAFLSVSLMFLEANLDFSCDPACLSEIFLPYSGTSHCLLPGFMGKLPPR